MKHTIIKLISSPKTYKVSSIFKPKVPALLQTVGTTNKEAFYKAITNVNSWYTKIIGLDEVKQYQDRVVSLQERLLQTQESRREIGRHLSDIRKKSNQLQDEIHNVKRSENIEKFLVLMKEETEVLKMEQDIANSFQEYDRAERELFSAFTNAVRDSHEKQRAQLEYTKYFGIILSIAGSFLAFCYTTFRKNDLKKLIEESLVSQSLVKHDLKHIPDKSSYSTPENSTSTADATSKLLMESVRKENLKLSELIKQTQHDLSYLVTLEKESKTLQTMFLVTSGIILCCILLVVVRPPS